ncbi:hypothetical protein C8J57DRAFT_1437138 [Mycena rebaudengoi]|nr:hypothetical protein C8J57DRAFT_1437138 [Mycena rebaudengoi]
MTILLTGGTGKTAIPLAKLLLQANQPVILANRSGKVPEPFRGTRFDWLDASTYSIPFEVDDKIDRVYIIAPLILDMVPPMKAFIDVAITKGVVRFVLLSSSMLEAGGPAMGQVHQYLSALGVQYYNFLIQYGDRIKAKSDIVSAAGDGLLGYVSTEDIADVAFGALVDEVIQKNEYIIVGPELVSYDKIAGMLSEILGRKITHTRLTEEQYMRVMMERGIPEDYARMLSSMDGSIAMEQMYLGNGRCGSFFEANKDAWRTSD